MKDIQAKLATTTVQVVKATVAGGAAALAVLALDGIAVRATLGYWVPLAARFIWAYALCGAVLGAILGVVGIAARGRAREALGAAGVASWTAALLYAPSLAERVQFALDPKMGRFKTVALVGAAAVGCALGVWVLSRILGPDRSSWAGWLIAAAAGAGLAINRNVVASPVEPMALVLDGAVVATTLLAAVGLRRFGPVLLVPPVALGAAWLLWGSVVTSTVVPASPPDRPHLVLLLIDTLRLDVFQDVVETTPEGRRFARAFEGSAWFRNAVAAAPWTAPSMASIMTGMYPREHGLVKPSGRRDLAVFTRLDEAVPTLAEKLERRGYAASAIIANPILHPQSGIHRGFDPYEVLAGPTVKLPLLTSLSRAGLLRREFYLPAAWVKSRLRHGLPSLGEDGRPVFLWLHLMDPHDPLYPHDLPADPGAGDLPELDRLYRDEVRYTLDQAADMVEMLDRRGIWDAAAVVLVSDHGEMLPSDGRGGPGKPPLDKLYGHGHALYDELARVPLVIRPPGGLPEPRRDVDALVHHTDLHDTLLDLLGSDARRVGRDRVSLLPWLGPEPPPVEPQGRAEALIEATHSGDEQRALRTLDKKVIHRFMSPRARPELYDLREDPGEVYDLGAERKGEAERWVERLTELWHGLDDPPATEAQELDDETLRQLEALGYL